MPTALLTVGSTTLPITVLSQSFIPIGLALMGSMSRGLTGVTGMGTGIGSRVSGVMTGGGGTIGGGVTGGGVGYVLKCESRQHKSPKRPKSPNNPGHHLQQSSWFLSMMIGDAAGAGAGLSMTMTLVFGAFCGGGMYGGGTGF